MAAYWSPTVDLSWRARILITMTFMIKQSRNKCLLQEALSRPEAVGRLGAGVSSRGCGESCNNYFVLDWQPLWQQHLDLVYNEKGERILGSEEVSGDILAALPDFLHTARGFVSPDPADLQLLVDTAMDKLQDTTTPACYEGVLLLVNCLPSWYPQYAEMLPLWVDKWQSIKHNAQWDCAWLTLLARARNRCPEAFPWGACLSLFMAKASELIDFPAAWLPEGEFPRSFLSYHASLWHPLDADCRLTSVRKLAKLIDFAAFHPPALVLNGEAGGDGVKSSMVLPLECCITLPRVVESALDSLKRGASQDSGDNRPGNSTAPTTSTESISMSRHMFSTSAVHSTGELDTISTELVHSGAVQIARFLQSIRGYFFPASSGGAVSCAAYLFYGLVKQLSKRAGYAAAVQCLRAADSDRTSSSGNVCVVGGGRGEREREGGDDDGVDVHLLHLPTVRYLMRECYLPFALEGFYSVSNAMYSCCQTAISDLLALDPLLGHAVLPFWIEALNPEAASQPHQVPLALSALTTCFHSLLYPQPVILRCAPETEWILTIVYYMDPYDSVLHGTPGLFFIALSWTCIIINFLLF